MVRSLVEFCRSPCRLSIAAIQALTQSAATEGANPKAPWLADLLRLDHCASRLPGSLRSGSPLYGWPLMMSPAVLFVLRRRQPGEPIRRVREVAVTIDGYARARQGIPHLRRDFRPG